MDVWPLIYEDPDYGETVNEQHARLVTEYLQAEDDDEAFGLLNQIRSLMGMSGLERNKYAA